METTPFLCVETPAGASWTICVYVFRVLRFSSSKGLQFYGSTVLQFYGSTVLQIEVWWILRISAFRLYCLRGALYVSDKMSKGT